jgi:hypothetical protein
MVTLQQKMPLLPHFFRYLSFTKPPRAKALIALLFLLLAYDLALNEAMA